MCESKRRRAASFQEAATPRVRIPGFCPPPHRAPRSMDKTETDTAASILLKLSALPQARRPVPCSDDQAACACDDNYLDRILALERRRLSDACVPPWEWEVVKRQASL